MQPLLILSALFTSSPFCLPKSWCFVQPPVEDQHCLPGIPHPTAGDQCCYRRPALPVRNTTSCCQRPTSTACQEPHFPKRSAPDSYFQKCTLKMPLKSPVLVLQNSCGRSTRRLLSLIQLLGQKIINQNYGISLVAKETLPLLPKEINQHVNIK